MSRTNPAASKTLSEREHEYLRRLAAGQSGKQAYSEMLVGKKTAEEYSFEIRRKLGARTTEHAVAIALRTGVIK